MPDFLISSGKNVADFPYLFQKLRFRISHLLLERVQILTQSTNHDTCIQTFTYQLHPTTNEECKDITSI